MKIKFYERKQSFDKGTAEEKSISVGEYIDSYFPAVDGVIITVHNYATYLNNGSSRCYVATAEGPKGYKDEQAYEVIRYRSVPIPKRKPYRFGTPMLDLGFELKERDITADIVHTHTPFAAGLEAMRFSKTKKVPLVASFHSKYYDDILQATNSKLLAGGGVDVIVGFFNLCDYVWTVNEGTANTLRDYGYKKDIEIMPNGTDFTQPKSETDARQQVNEMYGLDDNDKLVIFVGQQILQKNLVKLIDAFIACKNEGKNFKVIMAGEGVAAEQLKKQAHEGGCDDMIIFPGKITDREKLCALYTRADILAFPSVYDNAPLVVREAAAGGCPSILVSGSNAAEGTKDGFNAYHCDNSMRSIKEAIIRALDNDEERKEISRAAKKTIPISWREVVGMVETRYREMIAEYNKNKFYL